MLCCCIGSTRTVGESQGTPVAQWVRGINSGVPFDDVLTQVTSFAIAICPDLSNLAYVSVSTVTSQTDKTQLVAEGRPVAQTTRKPTRTPSEPGGLLETVAQKRTRVVLRDMLERNARPYRECDRAFVENADRALLALPVCLNGVGVGALVACSKTAGHFSETRCRQMAGVVAGLEKYLETSKLTTLLRRSVDLSVGPAPAANRGRPELPPTVIE